MSIRARIDDAIGKNKQQILTAFIIAKLSEAVDDDEVSVEARSRFDDLGIDSKRALEMKEDMEDELACSFRSTLLFDYPSPESLAQYIVENIIEAKSEPVQDNYMSGEPNGESIASNNNFDVDKELDAILSEFDV